MLIREVISILSGPLAVSDVTSTSCNLKWKPSEDDGGKPITGYVVEKMDKDTGRWMVCARTDPDVTECPIRGLQDGHDYMFRVKAVNDEGDSEPLETEAATKAKDPYGKELKLSQSSLHAVKLDRGRMKHFVMLEQTDSNVSYQGRCTERFRVSPRTRFGRSYIQRLSGNTITQPSYLSFPKPCNSNFYAYTM